MNPIDVLVSKWLLPTKNTREFADISVTVPDEKAFKSIVISCLQCVYGEVGCTLLRTLTIFVTLSLIRNYCMLVLLLLILLML